MFKRTKITKRIDGEYEDSQPILEGYNIDFVHPDLDDAGIPKKDQSTANIICGIIVLATLCVALYLIF